MRNPNATPPRVIAETFRNALTCLPHRAWQAGSGRYQVMSRNWHHMFPHELAFLSMLRRPASSVRAVRTVRPACMPSESFIRKGLESIGPNWKSNAIIEMEPASKFYEVLLLAPLVRTHRLTVRYTTCILQPPKLPGDGVHVHRFLVAFRTPRLHRLGYNVKRAWGRRAAG